LPIDRPRRIFRSGFPRLDARGAALTLGVGVIAAAGVALAMLPHREAAPPAAATSPDDLPRGEELRAQPAQVAVVDGGTLRLGDRVVRLRGVEPPSRGTACAKDEDCAAAATNALATLVRDVPVVCRVTGADALGRSFAVCQASGVELNRAVVAAGWARADGGQPALQRAEAAARAERRGFWAADRSW